MAETAGNSKKTAKPRGRPFAKGQSGNPNGRPPVDQAVKEMLKGATAQAAQLLIELMENPETKPELRKACAETILDRVYGKSTQPIDGAVENTVTIRLAGALEEWSK